MKIFQKIVTFCFLIFSTLGLSSVTTEINCLISKHSSSWPLSPEIVMQEKFQKNFLVSTNILKEGYTSQQVWLKIDCLNSSSIANNLHIEIGYPLLKIVDFYSNTFTLPDYSLGRHTRVLSLNDPETSRFPTADYNFLPHEKKIVFVRIASEGPIIGLIKLYSDVQLVKSERSISLFYGGYYGFLLSNIILVLFLIFTSILFYDKRDLSIFVVYFLYVSTNTLYQFTYAGLSHVYLWPQSGYFPYRALLTLSPILMCFLNEYGRRFLNLKFYYPLIDKILLIYSIVNLLLIAFCYYGDFAFFSKLMSQLSFTFLLFYVSFSLFLVFRKTPNSVLYFLGWASYSIGLSILLLRNFKLFPYNFFTSHAQEVGTIIEVLFFSISLVNRARLKKEESVSFSAVSNMVSMLAHELKRPLKVAVTELKDLQCKFPDKERPLIDLTVAVVDSSFQRLIKLLNEFRFIGKERSILIKNKINLVEIAKESSSRIRQGTQDFSGEISIVEKNIVIKGLKEDFLKVFDNLFENAIEAGGKNTSVKFDIKKNIFGTVFISISNTGSVIPKHMHREVFKMSVTTKSNGHGVGLTLCKKIVEDYGGSINVSSNFKENSTVFRIILQT